MASDLTCLGSAGQLSGEKKNSPQVSDSSSPVSKPSSSTSSPISTSGKKGSQRKLLNEDIQTHCGGRGSLWWLPLLLKPSCPIPCVNVKLQHCLRHIVDLPLQDAF